VNCCKLEKMIAFFEARSTCLHKSTFVVLLDQGLSVFKPVFDLSTGLARQGELAPPDSFNNVSKRRFPTRLHSTRHRRKPSSSIPASHVHQFP
jgi:hypothetical protein